MMSWKAFSIEMSNEWVEALEKFADDNGLEGVKDAARTAIIVYLAEHGYIK